MNGNNNENRNEQGQVVVDTAKYGIKLDGTPKQKPGRKATGSVNKTKTIFVHHGKVVTRGKPSLEQIKHRRQVVVPAGVKYDANIHGLGTRLAADDQRAEEWEKEIANRELARKAAKAAAPTVTPEVTPEAAPEVTAPANNDTVTL